MKAPDSIRTLGLLVATTFRATPVLTPLVLVHSVVFAVAMPFQSLGLAKLLDGMVGRDAGAIELGAAMIIGGLFAVALMAATSSLVSSTLNERTNGYVHADLIRITSSVPGIELHENPKVSDKLQRTYEGTGLLSSSAGILTMLVSFALGGISVLGLLISVHPLLVLLPLVSLARIHASSRTARLSQDAQDATTARFRLARRISRIASEPAHGVETRVFGMRSFLTDRQQGLFSEVVGEREAAVRKGVRYELAVRLAFGLCYGGAVALAVALAKGGSVTPGEVALVVTLAPAMERSIDQLANSAGIITHMRRVFGHYLWLRDYAAEAVHRTSGKAEAPSTVRYGITLHNAAFRYPDTDRDALTDINLHLPAGTTVALVGENGAGKSTLVKLLARLYEPTSGRIDVDGTRLDSIDPDAWRTRVSAGFQDFVRFEFTAGEAIGIGDLPRLHDTEAISAAAERGDAATVLAKLPDGTEQRLGKRFTDGTELSGGQWQRLALARAFMREEPLLLLLDEPTAALDPEAEHTLFESFAEASRTAASRTGGITVLVSHRFSTVRMADLVVVMDGGRIIETGTHEDLLAADGRYAELFNLQARAYR